MPPTDAPSAHDIRELASGNHTAADNYDPIKHWLAEQYVGDTRAMREAVDFIILGVAPKHMLIALDADGPDGWADD